MIDKMLADSRKIEERQYGEILRNLGPGMKVYLEGFEIKYLGYSYRPPMGDKYRYRNNRIKGIVIGEQKLIKLIMNENRRPDKEQLVMF